MRLIISGGLGFVGSAFLRRALAEPSVTAILNVDCLTYAGSEENVAECANDSRYKWSRTDIRNKPAVNKLVEAFKPTHIVHLAAESHVDRSIAEPDSFLSTNVTGTFNLLEAARKAVGLELFLHVSTDEVYGSLNSSDAPFTEDSPYRPNSPYSASKAASDHLVRAYHRTYGLPSIITHSSNNYGPRQHQEKFIPTIIRSCVEMVSIPVYGDGYNRRDWIFVEDNCDALWDVLKKGQAGETYNIGADNEQTNNFIVERITDSWRARTGYIAKVQSVKDRPGHDFRYAVDNSKIKRELGWEPRTSFNDGIEMTIDWYLKPKCVACS